MNTLSVIVTVISYFVLSNSSQCNNISIENNTTVDSLLNQLKKEITDTNRIIIYSNLCQFYERTYPDTAKYFGNLGLKLAIKENYSKGIAVCYFNLGDVYYFQNNYDSSTTCYTKAVYFFEKSGDKKGMIQCFSNIGGNYYELGNYYKAIEYSLKSLRISDALGDKEGMARCNNNIGILYEEQRNNEKAIEYYINSLKIYNQLDNKSGIAACYINIGNVYMNKSAFEKSKEYFNNALIIHELTGDKKGISKCYNNIGLIFYQQKNYKTALEYYLKSLKIDKELNNISGISTVMINIARLNIKLRKYNEAIAYAQQSLSFADEIGAMQNKNEAYMFLSIAYDSLGSFKNAFEYHKLFKQTNDKLTNLENRKHITKMEAVYQNDKKQKEIELLNKDKILQTTELKKNRIILLAFIGGFILMTVLVLVIFNSLRQKKKAHKIISEKNEELNQQNEEIRSQRDEIETQKQQIELIHEELKDSIHYAERIQQAVLPADDFLKKILPDYFVLFKPQNIVSGDFYWITKVNNQIVVCVADCTGHGVPGAFMSMLGISFLNEIIRKKEVTCAGEVLNYLRDSVIEALKQKGESGEQKDGMDIALCTINTETLEMQFAGANNPVYVIAMAQPEAISTPQSDCFVPRNDEYNLIELKGDKQPIGIYERMTPFTNHTYQLYKNDIIYLMSDGYEDQFGGPKHKKFLSKNLKQLLTANNQKPVVEQKEILEKIITEWKGNLPQVDDICIMGIKV